MRCGKVLPAMSPMGQTRKWLRGVSVLLPTADIGTPTAQVRFVPLPDSMRTAASDRRRLVRRRYVARLRLQMEQPLGVTVRDLRAVALADRGAVQERGRGAQILKRVVCSEEDVV